MNDCADPCAKERTGRGRSHPESRRESAAALRLKTYRDKQVDSGASYT